MKETKKKVYATVYHIVLTYTKIKMLQITKNLQEMTKKMKRKDISASDMKELEDQFLLAKSLHLLTDHIEGSQKILNEQTKHLDTVSSL